jgi:hypothetical protein
MALIFLVLLLTFGECNRILREMYGIHLAIKDFPKSHLTEDKFNKRILYESFYELAEQLQVKIKENPLMIHHFAPFLSENFEFTLVAAASFYARGPKGIKSMYRNPRGDRWSLHWMFLKLLESRIDNWEEGYKNLCPMYNFVFQKYQDARTFPHRPRLTKCIDSAWLKEPNHRLSWPVK